MNKIRVLVADDHVLVREGIRQLLEREKDIDCVALAEDGEEAVKLTQEFLPDVAIIDVAMPKMNGIEVVRRIKEFYPHTAILVLSAYKYDHYVVACIGSGADGYLLKENLPGGRLADAVRMVYTGESVFDHQVTSKIQRKLASGKDEKKLGSSVLGNRELQVLKLAAKGMSNKEISYQLAISYLTVGTHLVNIFKKLGVESRMEAALYALKEGWVSVDELTCKQES